MLRMSRWLVIVFLALLVPVQVRAADAETESQRTPTGVVEIESGSLRGLAIGEQEDIHAFKGIPFAAPPVGELRWQPPQPAESWEGVRDCFKFGNASAQTVNPMLSAFPGMSLAAETSEDCLYLNIWRPADAPSEPLPVMVWIHGGGYVLGAASQPLYNGEQLARAGVVMVGVNYRLGAAGFLAHPALSAESEHKASGNYGILDQIAALEWVQRNIAAFGGDPDRVTIFGESAGGGSVFTLLVSPLAKGLFHRAIAESGPSLTFAHLRESLWGFESAEETGLEIGRACGLEEPQTAEALRELSIEQLLAKTPGMSGAPELRLRSNNLRMAPVVDGWVVPDDPMTIFAEGRQNDVPLIVGSNRDEATMFTMMTRLPTSVEAANELTRREFGGQAEAILAAYPVAARADIRRSINALLGDLIFVAPARYVARSMGNVSSPVYCYHFAHVPPGPTGAMMGAHHASEIAYVFKQLSLAPTVSAADERIAELMQGYWVQFAATGDPNGEGLPNWPAFETESDEALVFGDDDIEVVSGLRKPQLDVIDAFMEDWRNE